MGCDIHGFIEVKYKGEWYTYDKIPLGTRNYTLFGLIAGVRDESVTPISQPKGIPKDVTPIVKIEIKKIGVDGHSHTWLSKKEMKKVYEDLDGYTRKLQKEDKQEEKEAWLVYGIDSFVYQLCAYGSYFLSENKQYKDVRMIIWFDN